MVYTRKLVQAALIGAVVALSACSTERVVDNTVDATGFVTKTAVKGTIGAGRLAVKGARKITGTDS